MSHTPTHNEDLADLIIGAVREVEKQTSGKTPSPSAGALASIQSAALAGRATNFDAAIDSVFLNLSSPSLSEQQLISFGTKGVTPPKRTPQYPSQGIAKLQEQLVLGGYLNLNNYRELQAFGSLGRPSEDTRTALRRLYKEAADNNMDPMAYLAARVQSGGFGKTGGGGTRRAPFVAKLSHPDDLRRVFQAAARQLIGREVDSSQADSFIRSYQAEERGAQGKAYSAAESGGTVTAPPDPTTVAVTEIEQKFPQEVFGQNLRNAMEGLLAAVRGQVAPESFGP